MGREPGGVQAMGKKGTMTDRIAAAYALVPEIHCKGLCGSHCGPIGCSAAELDRMRENGALPPRLRQHPKHGIMCSHLTDGDRCAIYENRPMVCRLFGVVRRLKCPHGCKPARGFWTDDEATLALGAVDDGRPQYRALGDFGMRTEP